MLGVSPTLPNKFVIVPALTYDRIDIVVYVHSDNTSYRGLIYVRRLQSAATFPENTMESFKAAIAVGAHAIESGTLVPIGKRPWIFMISRRPRHS